MARKGGNPVFNKENAREYQLRGAKKRKENRLMRIEEEKKKKQLADSLKLLLGKAMRKGKLVEPEVIENIAEASDINISAQDAMAVALIQRACLGDVQAATFIRDTIGEKPTDKVELDESKTIETWAKTHEIML